ncbi:MAG: NIPSNAP family protein, partial [Actinomycetia bacterium]|nr:NIPSNAP family protein [Actinomycetes bacterium]
MIVEQRDYHIYTGKLKEVVRLYETEGIIIQEEILGNLLGWFTVDVGGLSTISAMWGYENYAEREQRRATLAADQRWQAFLPKLTPL